MNILSLIKAAQKPILYEKGTSIMWTDEHISKHLLKYHLDPEVDAASRKISTIKIIVDWILGLINKPKMNILDLGSGPGLYSEILAQKEHKVTGVDFSKNSIEYAKNQAEKNNLEIEYINQNYLDLDYNKQFDLVMLIYTDFGVLLPYERNKLLENIHRALKQGGIFLFDVLNDKNIEQKILKQSWDLKKSGFWKDDPYLSLNEGYHYPDEKVLLNQHIIIDESNKHEIYRFWSHYFNKEDLIPILKSKGFKDIETHENILPESDVWNGENVTFYTTVKK